jgi:hypothetical protein
MAFFIAYCIAQQAPGLQRKTRTEGGTRESAAWLLGVWLGPRGLISRGVRHAHSGPIHHDYPSALQSSEVRSVRWLRGRVVENGF